MSTAPRKRVGPYLLSFLSAATCFYAAHAVHNAEKSRDLVKIKPFDFAAEQAALRDITVSEVDVVRMSADMLGVSFEEMRGMYLEDHRTPEQKRMGQLPLADYIAERTAGRAIPAEGTAWDVYLGAVIKSGEGLESRRSEQAGIQSFFVPPEEGPVSLIADNLQPEETNWLQQVSSGAWFEVYRLSPGRWSGVESGTHDVALTWRVPDAFRYPWRRWTRSLIVLGVLLLVGAPLFRLAAFLNRRGVAARPDFVNREKHVAKAWSWVALVATGLCILPGALGADMMRFGFALAFVSGFVAFVGVIVVYAYARRAAQLDRMVNGEGLLAHWTYTEDEWRNFSTGNRGRDEARTKGLLTVMAVFFVLFGGGAFIFDKEGGALTFGLMMAILAVIGVFAYAAVRARARAAETAPREVYISLACAYVGGQMHSWTTMMARLEEAKSVGGEHPEIEITYSYPGRHSREFWTFRIPVPAGRSAEADGVVAALQQRARR